MLITAFILGFAFSGAPRASFALLILLTLVSSLIIDLDRPTTGRIQESQRAMEVLKERFRTSSPADFDRSQRHYTVPPSSAGMKPSGT
jgi:hypothetical protein